MLSDTVLQKITEIADSIAAREGCKLYDVEFANQAGQRTLRVYIDKENELIGIEDCSNVSKGLNTVLDADDVIPGGEYNLEVSSPGLERRLRVPWHFEAAAGKKIWMQINQALSNFGVKSQSVILAKKFEAECLGVDGLAVKIKIADEFINVPMDVIEKAHVVFDFESAGKKKQKR